MTDALKNKLEHLLDDPAAGADADRLRSRLAATLSEGLNDDAGHASESGTPDPAAMAAFIDGELTGAEREKVAAALARQPRLRADIESAAELVSSVAESPSAVPKALLARAQAQFAPVAPAAPERRPAWSLSLEALFPRRRLALAALAALAIVVAVPAGLVITGRIGGGGEDPELSSVNEPESPAQRCKDRTKDAVKATAQDTAKDTSKAAKPADKSAPAAKDPCDQPTPGKDGSAKK
jgi:hypothetical protein